MQITDCPCGEIHELRREAAEYLHAMVSLHGPTIPVTTPEGRWRVPRVWIACHGLYAPEVPGLAARYGWEQVP